MRLDDGECPDECGGRNGGGTGGVLMILNPYLTGGGRVG